MTDEQKLVCQKIILEANKNWDVKKEAQEVEVLFNKIFRATGLLLTTITTDENGLPVEWR